jgi:tellurite resistance protein TerC
MPSSWIPWIVFNVFVLLMLALDLGVFHRKSHTVKVKEALIWSAVWVAMALIFNAGIWHFKGSTVAAQFFAGYVIEKSLSVDNLFVFLVLFSFFKVKAEYQHKVLFWGILGALIMRAAMIAVGAALIKKFGWVMYVFGGFLVLTGVKLAFSHEDEKAAGENFAVRLFRKLFPVTPDYHGDRFFVLENGKRFATPLFLVLITVEMTDLVFALDSIPAIFAVTLDPFIVYTSNVFAILGLRSLYFALAGSMGLFVYLRYGLAIILAFVGVKMLIPMVWNYHVPIGISLSVILGVLAITILASLFCPPKRKKEEEERAPAALPAGAPATGSAAHLFVPLDGSREAERALDVVTALRPAKVTLLHVAEPGAAAVEGAYFDAVEKRLKEAGVADIRRLHRAGDPSAIILAEAPTSGAGLIALSMHGRSGWDLMRLGGVAERVLRGASLPVLAVPKGTSTTPADPLARVLAPQDGEELSARALKRLVELFPAAASSLTLLGVVEAIGGPGDEVTARAYERRQDDLKGDLERLAAGLPAKPEIRVDLGPVAAKICEHADKTRASLIAMATHARSGVARLTLGSVTEQVLKGAQVPVLVLR